MTDERPPLDVDRAHELLIALLSLLAAVGGTLGGAWALSVYLWFPAGPLLVLAVGLLGCGYSLVKAEQRRAAREREEREARFRNGAPSAFGSASIQVRP